MASPYVAVAKMIWRESHGRIAWVILLALIAGLTEGISVSMLIPIVATASPETAAQASQIPVIGRWLSGNNLGLPLLLVIFVLLVTTQAALNFIKNYFSLHLMQLISDQLKRRLFFVLSAAKWDAIAKRRLPDVNNVLTAGVPRCMSAAMALVGLIQASIMIVIYVGLAAVVSWQMALFSSIVGSALFGVMYPIRKMATRYGERLTRLFERQSRITLEFLNGVRLAKTLLAEPTFRGSYDKHLQTIRRGTLSFYAVSSASSFYFQVSVAVVAACFVYLAIEIIEVGLGEIAVLLIIFARLTPRFGMIQDQGQQFLSNAPAYSQYQEMVSYFDTANEPCPSSADVAPTFSSVISIENISMRYSTDNPLSLRDISGQIRAGRITAIIGPSGSGKSTLADIVAGLVSPSSGRIVVDDTVIDDANRRLWRSRIAIVPQDPFLFDTSISDNLKLAKPDASEEEMWTALGRAQIAAHIRRLPAGLNTRVGSRGARFSGGERQRIVIARALLPDPEILILDEATSALDDENQRLLASLIQTLRDDGLSILLIAHQSSLTDIADDVIRLDKGQIRSN